MVQKKPLFEVALGFISREVGASLKSPSQSVRTVKSIQIEAVLKLLSDAALSEAEARHVCHVLRSLADEGNKASLRVVTDLDVTRKKLITEYHLAASA